MQRRMKVGLVSVLAILGISALNNQAATNVVMTTSIALRGEKQDDNNATSVRITNKELLTALNNAGGFGFGRNAKIILVSENDQLPTFAVRDKSGSTTTTTDVSNFLQLGVDVEVHGNQNTRSYAFQTITFNDHNGTAFSVSGVTNLRRTTIRGTGIGPLFRVSSASATLSGDGEVDGSSAVLTGTLTAGSAKSEISD